ncbi:MAG: hypothetical protein NWE96_06910 [Candidatus Bathyarchaeota archaeon]|nr:hypothetical protein [Candidatus Bathyarchaeota archaeon]
MGEKKQFTCQNPSCKTTFTTPLKTLNLQENPSEPYFACPFCLTKVEELAVVKNREPPAKNEDEEVIAPKQESKKHSQKNGTCRFHVGYLSERTNKEQIPDDCLVCKDIVDCMLKKMQE